MKLTATTVHRLAIVAAAGMSAIALFDAFTKAAFDHLSVFSDESDVPWLLTSSNLVHGAAYVGLLAVLVQHRHLIDATNRVARVTRWLLVVSLAVLAAGFLFLTPFVDPQSMPAALGAPIGISFMVMLLTAPVLGIAVRRVAGLRPGSVLLIGMLPILGVTLALGAVAPRFAHPAYLEAALGMGIALLGYRAARVESEASTEEPRGVVV